MTEQEYCVIAAGPTRHFAITGGLRPGYGPDAPAAWLSQVVYLHHAWQSEEGVVLGCTICDARISYGRILQDGSIHGDSEPGFRLSGEISVLYDAGLSDEEAQARVLRLALYLACNLQQERIYVTYRDQSLILERTHTESAPEG